MCSYYNLSSECGFGNLCFSTFLLSTELARPEYTLDVCRSPFFEQLVQTMPASQGQPQLLQGGHAVVFSGDDDSSAYWTVGLLGIGFDDCSFPWNSILCELSRSSCKEGVAILPVDRDENIRLTQQNPSFRPASRSISTV